MRVKKKLCGTIKIGRANCRNKPYKSKKSSLYAIGKGLMSGGEQRFWISEFHHKGVSPGRPRTPSRSWGWRGGGEGAWRGWGAGEAEVGGGGDGREVYVIVSKI